MANLAFTPTSYSFILEEKTRFFNFLKAFPADDPNRDTIAGQEGVSSLFLQIEEEEEQKIGENCAPESDLVM
ncbi:hypothetical protein MRB53_021053 [Persea americana]|uniref:Uncharacterized protein n=1 Tax=Persea americana TaxID=3435 RepID=A0ACC2L2I3_PERAE|nr:hypothetical protein MRB53_021053 [Persea americana]